MSHSRVSLGRTASPCITGRWGRPPRGPGAGRCAREGPGPGLQGAPLTAPFLPPPPSAPSSRLGCLLVRAVGLCGSRRGEVHRAQTHSLPSECFQATTGSRFIKKKKSQRKGPGHPVGPLVSTTPSGSLKRNEPSPQVYLKRSQSFASRGDRTLIMVHSGPLNLNSGSHKFHVRVSQDLIFHQSATHGWHRNAHADTCPPRGNSKEPRYLGGEDDG